MNLRISSHAEFELQRRQIPRELFTKLLDEPEQVIDLAEQRVAYQMRFGEGGRHYLLRAIIDRRTSPWCVVTVYKTSKVEKYWRA